MESQSDNIVVMITAPDARQAKEIGTFLLQNHKIACCNIVPSVQSGFWWKGKLEYEQESLLICKTRSAALPALMELVKSVHSYEVSEIIVLPIIDGSGDYLQWIGEEIEP